MRTRMRVIGMAMAVRGSVRSIDPVANTFSVEFDVEIGPEGNKLKLLRFSQDNDVVKDEHFGLIWEVVN